MKRGLEGTLRFQYIESRWHMAWMIDDRAEWSRMAAFLAGATLMYPTQDDGVFEDLRLLYDIASMRIRMVRK